MAQMSSNLGPWRYLTSEVFNSGAFIEKPLYLPNRIIFLIFFFLIMVTLSLKVIITNPKILNTIFFPINNQFFHKL